MPKPRRPRPTRRQRRLLQQFSDGIDEMFSILDGLPNRRAALDEDAAAKGRRTLAAGYRLLAGAGLAPTMMLRRTWEVRPGDMLVALLAAREAVEPLLATFDIPETETYPRSRERY